MTIEALGRKATTPGDGVSTGPFPIPFAFQDGGLSIYLLASATADNADGTLLTEGVHYSVAGDGAAGAAEYTTVATYAAGQYLRAWRETSRDQVQDYTTGAFPAQPSNVALDRLAMVDEEIADDIGTLSDRAVQVPAGEDAIVLPAVDERAGLYAKFGAAGEIIAAAGTVTAPDLDSMKVLSNYPSAAAALADVGRGAALYVDQESDAGASAPADPGVDKIGQFAIHYDLGDGKGSHVVNQIGRNPFLLRWGLERLTQQFLNKVRSGSAFKVIIIGDSNAALWWGAVFANLLAGLPGGTIINNAVSSSTLDDWYNDTGTINGTGKDFTATMAADPDLLVDAYAGDTNGPNYGGTAASFNTLQASVYAAIRNHTNGGKAAMGLLAVTAPPMRDGGAMSIEGGAKRDELHSARVRTSTLRNCNAFAVKAAFFDINSLLCDAELADLDSNLHGQNSMADIAAHSLFEWLIPAVYRGGGPTYIGTKAAAAAPSTYHDNISTYRMSDGAFDGFGVHIRPSFGATPHGIQFNWQYSAPGQIAVRHVYNGNLFGGWQYIGQTAVEAATAASGYTNPAASDGLNARRDGAMTSLQGHITKDTPGTIAATTTLATLLTPYRPSVPINGVVLTCKTAGGAYEHIFASIETNGTIVTRSAAASTVSEIHFNASFRFAP